MQALTGLWAQQFGTPNWAAHGGFCSVNMAAAGLYTIGYSFWEFGAPDWDRAKYFVLWGVAEDHSSNPIKIGLDKLKRHGAKFVSINPVRTGYSAIADEWVPIRPGTDGLLALAMVHVLLRDGTIDYRVPGALHQCAMARDRRARALPTTACSRATREARPLLFDEARGAAIWDVTTATARRVRNVHARRRAHVKTVLTLAAERYLDDDYSPDRRCRALRRSSRHHRRLAHEMAHVAFQETIDCRSVDRRVGP